MNFYNLQLTAYSLRLSMSISFSVSFFLYFLFTLLFFLANYFGFNVDKEFEFWSLLFVISGMVASYGYLAFELLRTIPDVLTLKKWIPLAGIFFIGLYFFMPHPEYILNDTHIYSFHAKMFAHYHVNPYAIAPHAFSHDPWFSFVAPWNNQLFNYGPLWLFLSLAPLTLSKSIFVAEWLFRALALLFFLGSVFIFRNIISSPYSSPLREGVHEGLVKGFEGMNGIFLFLTNPLLLYWGITGAHNDIAGLFFLLLALLAFKKKYFFLGTAAISAAVLIKYIFIIFFPLFLLYARQEKNNHHLKALVKYTMLFLGILLFFYAPFWSGYKNFFGFSSLQNPRLSGPLFIALYLFLKQNFFLKTEIFFALKDFVFGIFLAGYSIVLLHFLRRLFDFQKFITACIAVFIWFALTSFWFQPWYALWIVPFFLIHFYFAKTQKEILSILFLLSLVAYYSMTYYILSYTYSSFFGWSISTIFSFSIFFLIFFSCFFRKNKVYV